MLTTIKKENHKININSCDICLCNIDIATVMFHRAFKPVETRECECPHCGAPVFVKRIPVIEYIN